MALRLDVRTAFFLLLLAVTTVLVSRIVVPFLTYLLAALLLAFLLYPIHAHRHDLEAVNLRIGWYMSEADLWATVEEDGDPGRTRFARATWLGPHDCRDVHRKAATVDLPENPVTVNAVSRNDDRFHPITETMRLLGYEPRENSAEVLGG
ncbi:hypothetical protein BRD00_00980 [Halobacteriales archaeon QS_8_69_26]|nr:MAG: hypothetical protein BRD00_00980 [Halobacteriales archaeon QS_8_69_26]